MDLHKRQCVKSNPLSQIFHSCQIHLAATTNSTLALELQPHFKSTTTSIAANSSRSDLPQPQRFALFNYINTSAKSCKELIWVKITHLDPFRNIRSCIHLLHGYRSTHANRREASEQQRVRTNWWTERKNWCLLVMILVEVTPGFVL